MARPRHHSTSFLADNRREAAPRQRNPTVLFEKTRESKSKELMYAVRMQFLSEEESMRTTFSQSTPPAFRLQPPDEFRSRNELAKTRARHRQERRRAAEAKASGGGLMMNAHDIMSKSAPAGTGGGGDPTTLLDDKVHNFLATWANGERPSESLEGRIERKGRETLRVKKEKELERLAALRLERGSHEHRPSEAEANAWVQTWQAGCWFWFNELTGEATTTCPNDALPRAPDAEAAELRVTSKAMTEYARGTGAPVYEDSDYKDLLEMLDDAATKSSRRSRAAKPKRIV